ncbi:2'-deoxycytidine 5'-triphosphate deaminase domain-containing protein [Streptomyces longwoodensis]|uniref:dCTP deaminase n=1 Tax=Streptomyces longwoodensis TaxID=68231 RepID=UPI0036F19194
MILTGREIARQRQLGAVTIAPFEPSQLNPQSYNYRLGQTVRVHRTQVADTHAEHELEEIRLPAEGLVLQPGTVYLGTTAEVIGSDRFAMRLIGRSSLGRLGLFLQYSADLGHRGSRHRWTLELEATQPIRVYPGMKIGQVSFWRTAGPPLPYAGTFGHRSHASVPPPHLLAAS